MFIRFIWQLFHIDYEIFVVLLIPGSFNSGVVVAQNGSNIDLIVWQDDHNPLLRTDKQTLPSLYKLSCIVLPSLVL